jgi:hypothetical protein
MVTHCKIVDPLKFYTKICNFRSLKNMFLINIKLLTAGAVAEIQTVCFCTY